MSNTLRDAERLLAPFYAERVFLARIVSVGQGGYMVEPSEAVGATIGPCAYASGVAGLAAGTLVKCQRVEGVVIVEYEVRTTDAQGVA